MAYKFVSVAVAQSDAIGFTENQRVATELQATFSLVQAPPIQYKNLLYPRYRNFFGYAQIMSGAYVIESIELRHINQQMCAWRAPEIGILETIGCYSKALAEGLIPPRNLITNTVLVRQPLTSIRFRLIAGTLANCGIRWEEFEPKCGGNVIPPDRKQGEPIPPNNASSSPSAASQGQEGDGSDRSNNDGNYNPQDGNPPAPTPGSGETIAHWYISIIGVQLRCDGDPITYPLPGLTNPSQRPEWFPLTANPACPNAMDGELRIDGVVVGSPTGVISVIGIDFY